MKCKAPTRVTIKCQITKVHAVTLWKTNHVLRDTERLESWWTFEENYLKFAQGCFSLTVGTER